MLCPGCGRELPDGSKFCPNCGYKLAASVPADPAPDAYTATPASPAAPDLSAAKAESRKKRSHLPFIIIAVIVIAAATAAVYYFVFRYAPVALDLNDYVVMEAEGYDGYGTVTVSLDYDRMQEDYGNARLKWKGSEYPSDVTPVEAIEEYVHLKGSTFSGLSNGDTITVEVDLNTYNQYESNLTVTFDPEVKYTADGFEPLTDLDPFESFSCEVSGYEGGSDCAYGFTEDGLAQNEVLGLLTIDYDCADDLQSLHNGDVITFTVSGTDFDPDYYAEQYGVNITNTAYPFTVGGLAPGNHYVTDSSEIPAEYYEGLGNEMGDWLRSDWLSKDADDYTYELVGWAYGPEALNDDSKYENIYFVLIKGTVVIEGESFSTYYLTYITDLYYLAAAQEYTFAEGSYDSSYYMSTGSDDSYTSFTSKNYEITSYGLASRDDLVNWIDDFVGNSFELDWHLD